MQAFPAISTATHIAQVDWARMHSAEEGKSNVRDGSLTCLRANLVGLGSQRNGHRVYISINDSDNRVLISFHSWARNHTLGIPHLRARKSNCPRLSSRTWTTIGRLERSIIVKPCSPGDFGAFMVRVKRENLCSYGPSFQYHPFSWSRSRLGKGAHSSRFDSRVPEIYLSEFYRNSRVQFASRTARFEEAKSREGKRRQNTARYRRSEYERWGLSC